jgi:hypothetical protein
MMSDRSSGEPRHGNGKHATKLLQHTMGIDMVVVTLHARKRYVRRRLFCRDARPVNPTLWLRLLPRPAGAHDT